MNKKAQLRPYVMGLMLTILASLFLFTFIASFIGITNPNSNVLSSKYGLNKSIEKLNSNVSGFNIIADKMKSELGSSKPDALQYVFLIFQGAFYIPKMVLDFMGIGISLLTTLIFPNLGGTAGTIVRISLGVIISVVILTIVFFIVKTIRTGESER